HFGVPVRRTHRGRGCWGQSRDLRVDEGIARDRRRNRPGLVRSAGSSEPVSPALCHASVPDGGRTGWSRHRRAGGAVAFLPRATDGRHGYARAQLIGTAMAGNSTAEATSLTSALKRIVRSYNAAGFLAVLLTVLLV